MSTQIWEANRLADGIRIEHSGETIVLMDSSKEDRRSTFPICELGDVSCVVTDGGTTDEFAKACRESGVELL